MDIFTINALVKKLKVEAEKTQQLAISQVEKIKEDIKQVRLLVVMGMIPKERVEAIDKLEIQLEDLSTKLNGTIHFLSNPEAPALMESAIRSKGHDPEKWIMEALDDPQKLADMVASLVREDTLF